jgi:hypothetical protein
MSHRRQASQCGIPLSHCTQKLYGDPLSKGMIATVRQQAAGVFQHDVKISRCSIV